MNEICQNTECQKRIDNKYIMFQGRLMEHDINGEHRYLTYQHDEDLYFCNFVCFLKWIGEQQEKVWWIKDKFTPNRAPSHENTD
jgi:hypothetical protein